MVTYEEIYKKYGCIEAAMDFGKRAKNIKMTPKEFDEVFKIMKESTGEEEEYLKCLLFLAALTRGNKWIFKNKGANNLHDLQQEAFLIFLKYLEQPLTSEELSRKFFFRLKVEMPRYNAKNNLAAKFKLEKLDEVPDFYDRLRERRAEMIASENSNIEKIIVIMEAAEKTLSKDEYNVFLLYSKILGKFTYEEISQELNIDKDRVRYLITSCKKKLKKVLSIEDFE